VLSCLTDQQLCKAHESGIHIPPTAVPSAPPVTTLLKACEPALQAALLTMLLSSKWKKHTFSQIKLNIFLLTTCE
jgi:hypothetical protein